MNFIVIGVLLFIVTVVAFGLWIAEVNKNSDKAPETRNHAARTFLMLCLFMDAVALAAVAYVFSSLDLPFDRKDGGLKERPLTQKEIHQLADRGLPNLPTGTLVRENEYGRQYVLKAPEGHMIPWGNFQLRYFSLDFGAKSIKGNLPTLYVMGEKDTICSTDETVIYDRKRHAPANSLHFDDYTLATCSVTHLTLKGLSLPLKFENVRYYNMAFDGENNIYVPLNAVAQYEVSHNATTLLLHTLNQSDTTFVRVERIYTDNQNQVLAMAVSFINDEEEDKMKIGRCDYEPYRSLVILNDFKGKQATWNFFQTFTSEQTIPPECQTQVLPYQIEILNEVR